MHVTFNFNCTPLAPPGIHVMAHDKPAHRTMYSPSALDGWYIGPVLESYQCYNVWIWKTCATHICDTISSFPTKATMPLASSTDLILAGIKDIVNALHNPSPGSALAPLVDSHVTALHHLTTVLTNIVVSAKDPEPQPPTEPMPSMSFPAAPLRRVVKPRPVPISKRPSSLSVHKDAATTKPSVRFLPFPALHVTNTFDNSTGPSGRQAPPYQAHHAWFERGASWQAPPLHTSAKQRLRDF